METLLILLFSGASITYDLPQGLLSALCFVESGHKPTSVHHDDGHSNSLGVCQVKLETAQLLGFKGEQKDLMNPAVNIQYAAKYLHKQITRYKGNTPMAVAAYNSGTFYPGPTFAKNQRYVDRVFTAWGEER